MFHFRSTPNRTNPSAAPSPRNAENRSVFGHPPSDPSEGSSPSARDTFSEPTRSGDPRIALGQPARAAPTRARWSPLLGFQGKNTAIPPHIHHRNHKHADDLTQGNIRAIDEEIRGALHQPDAARRIAALLTNLLDKPFFHLSRKIPPEEVLLLCNKLDDCPIHPEDATAKDYAESFLRAFTGLLTKFGERSPSEAGMAVLKDNIVTYLKSNRSEKARFETRLFAQTRNKERASAQKMAFETFTKAFPLVASDATSRLSLTKKLIDILPNLEHDEVIERNAQRRGIRALERALESLPPDDVAEALAHLMKNMGDLSQKLSRRRANFLKIRPNLGLHLIPTIFFGFGSAVLATALAVPPAAIAAAAGGTLWGGLEYFALHKQPKGTALSMLGNQLARLRKQWGDISPTHRQQIIEAFNHLLLNYDELEGTKQSTLRRFFNDRFIDPSRFPLKPDRVVELGRQLRHRILAPMTSRVRPLTLRPAAAPTHDEIPGYATATAPQKQLVDLLVRLHEDAEKAGVPDARFPDDFLTNLIEKTNTSEFEDAAAYIYSAFARVKEMPEFRFQSSRRRLLSQVVEMTRRLAAADETFVRDFAYVSEVADEDCGNNARRIFRELRNAVIIDKAKKGEDGLDDLSKLLALGRSFFHDHQLKAGAQEAFDLNKIDPEGAEYFEVEVGNAVEIALGRKLGIPSPIQGMAYTDEVRDLVTPEKLQIVQADVERRIGNTDALVDFLMSWTPLTQKIKGSPKFKEAVEGKIAQHSDKFERAQEEFFDVKDALCDALNVAKEVATDASPSHRSETRSAYEALEREIAEKIARLDASFEAAGAEYQSTSQEATTLTLREMIDDLVRQETARVPAADPSRAVASSSRVAHVGSLHTIHDVEETA